VKKKKEDIRGKRGGGDKGGIPFLHSASLGPGGEKRPYDRPSSDRKRKKKKEEKGSFRTIDQNQRSHSFPLPSLGKKRGEEKKGGGAHPEDKRQQPSILFLEERGSSIKSKGTTSYLQLGKRRRGVRPRAHTRSPSFLKEKRKREGHFLVSEKERRGDPHPRTPQLCPLKEERREKGIFSPLVEGKSAFLERKRIFQACKEGRLP